MASTQKKSKKYIVTKTLFPKEGNPYVIYQGDIIEESLEKDNIGENHGRVVLLTGERKGQQEATLDFQYVAELTDIEADLLLAVTSSDKRWRIVEEKQRLVEGKTLESGSKVLVVSEGREVPGVVQYKGNIQHSTGTTFIVALLDQNDAAGYSQLQDIDVIVAVDKIRPLTEEVKHLKSRTQRQSRTRKSKTGNEQCREDPQQTCDDKRPPERISRIFEDRLGELEGIFSVGLQTREAELEWNSYVAKQQFLELQKRCRLPEVFREMKEDYYKVKGRECDLQAMVQTEMQAREEKEKDLKECNRKLLELETKLATEAKTFAETEKLLKESITKLSEELETKLATEETEKRLHENNQQPAQEQTQQVIKGIETLSSRNNSSSNEVVEGLEPQSSEALEIDQCQRNALEKGGDSEQQSIEKLETVLGEYKKRVAELEKQLQLVQTKLNHCEGMAEKECDWMLKRDEIILTEEELGSGTFGTVYKGTFRDTQVAVKKVSVKLRITDYNKDNFRREMGMAARCRHPCMLQFIGATSDDQSPLLVTELLDTSLKDVLLERALKLNEIKIIALDVAKGINYLHLNQPNPIVHRDISSGNVLLWKHGESWRGKVSDYGNAVMMNYAKTCSGGAISYLAPEMGKERFSTKGDIYSFGVLLLEMCVRKEPSLDDIRDKLVCSVKDEKLKSLMRECFLEESTKRPPMNNIISRLVSLSKTYCNTTQNNE